MKHKNKNTMKMKQQFITLLFLSFSLIAAAQEQSTGEATVIDNRFIGLKMAGGEIYNEKELVAAHRTLDFGTKVKVTNLENGKSVIVTIKDRGPYVADKMLDLSQKSAELLGFSDKKSAKVRIEVVGVGTTTVATTPAPTAAPKPKPAVENTEKGEREVPVAYEEAPKKAEPVKKPTPKPAPKTVAPKVEANSPAATTGLFKVDVVEVPKKGFGVQVGTFASFDVVMKQVTTLKSKGFKDVLVAVTEDGDKTTYRIILGNHKDQDAATAYKKALKSKFGIDGFVVDFSKI
jgi:rare lipoprotein A